MSNCKYSKKTQNKCFSKFVFTFLVIFWWWPTDAWHQPFVTATQVATECHLHNPQNQPFTSPEGRNFSAWGKDCSSPNYFIATNCFMLSKQESPGIEAVVRMQNSEHTFCTKNNKMIDWTTKWNNMLLFLKTF